MPDRADGVDNVPGFEVASRGYDRLAGGKTALPGDDGLALFQDGGTAGAMNGAIHAATPHQAGIGGIDDGIGRLAVMSPFTMDT